MHIRIDRTGCTRVVILTKRFAFKLPIFTDGFPAFLNGLLANLNEAAYRKGVYEGVCPVLFALPLGLLIVMPKVKLLTDEEFIKFDYESFRVRANTISPENKANSFGWLNGKIVAIDYGN